MSVGRSRKTDVCSTVGVVNNFDKGHGNLPETCKLEVVSQCDYIFSIAARDKGDSGGTRRDKGCSKYEMGFYISRYRS